MAEIAPVAGTPAGTAVTYVAASAGGDSVVPGDSVYLHVRNGGGGAVTVTVDSKESCSMGFDHNLVVSVPAGSDRMIGPLSQRYVDPDTRRIGVTYSGVTSVTVAALSL